MRVLTSLGALALIVTMAAPACTAREQVSDSNAAAAAAPWYRRARTLDLTGDGGADTVRLEAVGARPDSLWITLRLIVAGEEKHREAWGSSYELALVDSAVRVRPSVDVFLRAQLDTVLASVVVRPLAAPTVRLMAEDSAVLAGLESRPRGLVSFSYGYETTVRLVWDASRQRFVRLWSCC